MLKFDATDFFLKIAKEGDVNNEMKSDVASYCDSIGTEMENYAKVNAPWKDRTGNARQTIEGGSKWQGESECAAYVAGNMEYSPYLELAHRKESEQDDGVGMEVGPSFSELELSNEGKYAILRPTVRKFEPEFVNGMENILK
ncbi:MULTISPECIES: hypothetical protein [Clostridium]|uniref:hypothetical protein n=1 Tax=Clostridium TaxID=1485 RepID=UPI000824C0E4|nr:MULTISPECIES: hypothetical protein [Clostridium]PJI07045.1 hypothetical protein CUB90_03830 [Clostridium sp. CT7]